MALKEPLIRQFEPTVRPELTVAVPLTDKLEPKDTESKADREPPTRKVAEATPPTLRPPAAMAEAKTLQEPEIREASPTDNPPSAFVFAPTETVEPKAALHATDSEDPRFNEPPIEQLDNKLAAEITEAVPEIAAEPEMERKAVLPHGGARTRVPDTETDRMNTSGEEIDRTGE